MTSLKDYIVKGQLGSGSFGVVFKAVRRSNKKPCVLKSVRVEELSRKEQEDAINEVAILSRIQSEFVVLYYDSFLEKGALHIVMEYCNRGDLQQLLRRVKERSERMPEQLIWTIFIQVLLGLNCIHRQRILHRDLKCANIFLSKEDPAAAAAASGGTTARRPKCAYRVKLGDLGVAKLLETSTAFARTIVGTPYYLSPELCQDCPYREKSDVWALGVVLYECCTLTRPFDAGNQFALIFKIIQGDFKRLRSTRHRSAALVRAIHWILNKEPDNRPNTEDLLAQEEIQQQVFELGFDLPSGITRRYFDGADDTEDDAERDRRDERSGSAFRRRRSGSTERPDGERRSTRSRSGSDGAGASAGDNGNGEAGAELPMSSVTTAEAAEEASAARRDRRAENVHGPRGAAQNGPRAVAPEAAGEAPVDTPGSSTSGAPTPRMPEDPLPEYIRDRPPVKTTNLGAAAVTGAVIVEPTVLSPRQAERNRKLHERPQRHNRRGRHENGSADDTDDDAPRTDTAAAANDGAGFGDDVDEEDAKSGDAGERPSRGSDTQAVLIPDHEAHMDMDRDMEKVRDIDSNADAGASADAAARLDTTTASLVEDGEPEVVQDTPASIAVTAAASGSTSARDTAVADTLAASLAAATSTAAMRSKEKDAAKRVAQPSRRPQRPGENSIRGDRVRGARQTRSVSHKATRRHQVGKVRVQRARPDSQRVAEAKSSSQTNTPRDAKTDYPPLEDDDGADTTDGEDDHSAGAGADERAETMSTEDDASVENGHSAGVDHHQSSSNNNLGGFSQAGSGTQTGERADTHADADAHAARHASDTESEHSVGQAKDMTWRILDDGDNPHRDTRTDVGVSGSMIHSRGSSTGMEDQAASSLATQDSSLGRGGDDKLSSAADTKSSEGTSQSSASSYKRALRAHGPSGGTDNDEGRGRLSHDSDGRIRESASEAAARTERTDERDSGDETWRSGATTLESVADGYDPNEATLLSRAEVRAQGILSRNQGNADDARGSANTIVAQQGQHRDAWQQAAASSTQNDVSGGLQIPADRKAHQGEEIPVYSRADVVEDPAVAESKLVRSASMDATEASSLWDKTSGNMNRAFAEEDAAVAAGPAGAAAGASAAVRSTSRGGGNVLGSTAASEVSTTVRVGDSALRRTGVTVLGEEEDQDLVDHTEDEDAYHIAPPVESAMTLRGESRQASVSGHAAPLRARSHSDGAKDADAAADANAATSFRSQRRVALEPYLRQQIKELQWNVAQVHDRCVSMLGEELVEEMRAICLHGTTSTQEELETLKNVIARELGGDMKRTLEAVYGVKQLLSMEYGLSQAEQELADLTGEGVGDQRTGGGAPTFESDDYADDPFEDESEEEVVVMR